MKYQYQTIGLKKKKRVLRPQSEWIPIKVPAIVSEETWETAQRQLKENKKEAKRNLKYEQLLNGLIFCSHCGRKMVITYSASGLAYYACLSQRSVSYCYSGREKCKARRIPAKILDNYVFNYFREFCGDSLLARKYFQEYLENNFNKSISPELKEKLFQLDANKLNILKRRETVINWFSRQIISKEEAEEQFAQISSQLLNIEELKHRYQSEAAAVAPVVSPEEVAAKLKFYFDRQEFTEDEKKSAVRAALDKVAASRVDDTFGRGSRPRLKLEIQLK